MSLLFETLRPWNSYDGRFESTICVNEPNKAFKTSAKIVKNLIISRTQEATTLVPNQTQHFANYARNPFVTPKNIDASTLGLR